MGERFTIELSPEQAQYLRRIAELSSQSIEDVLSEAMILLIPPSDSIETQLERLTSYSDAQLWAIVETPILSTEERLERENALENFQNNTASESDRKRLLELSDLYEKRELLRTESLLLLQERGFDVQAYLKKNKPARHLKTA